MIFFILILLSATPLWAAPEACSTVDLSSTPGAGFADIPRWSQGQSHLCYAFAASALIDHYRLTQGDKDRAHWTSPLLLSLKTIEHYQGLGSTLAGGKVEHAFSTAKQFGSCGSHLLSDKLGSVSTDQLLKTLSQYHQDAQEAPLNRKKIAAKVRHFLRLSKIKNAFLPEIPEIEKNLELNKSQFIIHTLTGFCEDVKKLDDLPRAQLLFQPKASSQDIQERLQNLLSSQIPVGINYCANVVTDPAHTGHWDGKRWLCEENKNHSAIVIGRKWMEGKCQYLIRDSGCEGYRPQAPERCHQGQYWLEAAALAQNLHGIFWLQ